MKKIIDVRIRWDNGEESNWSFNLEAKQRIFHGYVITRLMFQDNHERWLKEMEGK